MYVFLGFTTSGSFLNTYGFGFGIVSRSFFHLAFKSSMRFLSFNSRSFFSAISSNRFFSQRFCSSSSHLSGSSFAHLSISSSVAYSMIGLKMFSKICRVILRVRAAIFSADFHEFGARIWVKIFNTLNNLRARVANLSILRVILRVRVAILRVILRVRVAILRGVRILIKMMRRRNSNGVRGWDFRRAILLTIERVVRRGILISDLTIVLRVKKWRRRKAMSLIPDFMRWMDADRVACQI